jgi:hypothetical protein
MKYHHTGTQTNELHLNTHTFIINNSETNTVLYNTRLTCKQMEKENGGAINGLKYYL